MKKKTSLGIGDSMRSLTNLQEKVSRSNDFGTRLRSFLRAGGAPAAVCLILLLCLALSALALHASRSSAIIGQAHQRGHTLLQRSGRGGDRATQARVGSYYRRWQQLKLIAMPHREDLPKLQEHPQEKKSTDDGDASESGSATSGSLFKMKRIRSAADVFLGGSTPSLPSTFSSSSSSSFSPSSQSSSSFSPQSSTPPSSSSSQLPPPAWSLPTPYPISTHWAVITSIFEPSELIHQLADLPGWCTVVVGDLKGPETYKGFEGKCLVYLTPAMQESLPYRSLKYVKWNHFSRKNIGFIFAMHHGASVIYDTDDDNMLKRSELLQEWTSAKGRVPASFVLSRSGAGLINPYPMFLNESLHYVYPRGFPLDSVKDVTTRTEHPRSSNMDDGEKKHECSTVAIVQSLADVDPDVDAISRLAVPNVPFNFSEARAPKALVLDRRAFSPWNAQATLFFKEAFPLLLLPSSVHGRVSDIWRSYFALHVMLDSPDMCMAFSTPWVYQQRNAHTYLADFNSEIPLYQRATELVRHLAEPKRGRLLDLYADMYEYGIIEEEDIRLAEAWEQDLADVAKVVSKRHRLPQQMNALSKELQ